MIMDFATLLSFTFIASLLVMSPGPNGVLIAKTVPTSGKAQGFANVVGMGAAFYVHGALSILGISLILVQSAQAFFIVKMLGAAYLCWIGFKSLRDAWRGTTVTQDIQPARKRRTLVKAFVEGFLTNALNPKVSMFYLAAFPQFINQTQGALGASFTLVFIHSFDAEHDLDFCNGFALCTADQSRPQQHVSTLAKGRDRVCFHRFWRKTGDVEGVSSVI